MFVFIFPQPFVDFVLCWVFIYVVEMWSFESKYRSESEGKKKWEGREREREREGVWVGLGLGIVGWHVRRRGLQLWAVHVSLD